MRPQSIVNFDRLYLVAIVLGLVNSLMSFDHYRAILAADKAAAKLHLGDGMIWAGLAISLGLFLLLWYLVAYRASNLAKWVLILFTVLGLMTPPNSLRQLGAGAGLGILMSLAIEALRVVALSFLFKADAKAWLSGAPAKGDA